MSNYPPGVTGSEFAIAGPDYELETEEMCQRPWDGDSRRCDGRMIEVGYRDRRWQVCGECGYEVDLPSLREERYDTDERV